MDLKTPIFVKTENMYERKIAEDLDCGITIAMKVFGSKWKPCIIDSVNRGTDRPSGIHRYLPTASPRVLDMQLRELVQMGVLIKKNGNGFPLRTHYVLTTMGKSILPIIAHLDAWGLEHMEVVKKSLGAPGNRAA